MNLIDIAIPVLGFLTLLGSMLPFKKNNVPRYIFILLVGIFVMGFTMYQASDSSDTIDGINKNMISLIEQRKDDSVNNITFQQYLKDSFGIGRDGNKPIRIVYNTNNYYSEKNKIGKENPLTFKIIPENRELEQMLMNNGYTISNLDPKYKIEITYTGQIEDVGNNLYRYRGGFLILKINDQNCYVFKDFILHSTFSGGNSKEKTSSQIMEHLIKIILANRSNIYTKIKSCIK